MAPKQRGVHVSLRNVTPAVPGNDGERAMLKEDLQSLGCAGLMERPWNLKNEEFIQQFVLIREEKLERNNMFDTTIWDRPEEWTAGVWREVYDFQHCCAPLLDECLQHHGHKGDPGVTPGTCGTIGERAQVILVWVRALGRWERLPPTETTSHEG